MKLLSEFFKAVEYWAINNEVEVSYYDERTYQKIYNESTLDYIEEHIDEIEYCETDILEGEIKIYIKLTNNLPLT